MNLTVGVGAPKFEPVMMMVLLAELTAALLIVGVDWASSCAGLAMAGVDDWASSCAGLASARNKAAPTPRNLIRMFM